MTVRISFADGNTKDINIDTPMRAWVGENRFDNSDDMYYAKQVFEGSTYDGGQIGTSDPLVGLQGLFSSSDWFSIQDEPDKVYKTSAIVSLEYLQ